MITQLLIKKKRVSASFGEPEIEIYGNGVLISNGDTSPSLTDHTDFGDTSPSTTVDRVYTIQNPGTSDLTGISVSVPSGYTLQDAPATTIAAGGSDTFTVRFSGTFSASGYTNDVSVSSNELGDYDFRITSDIWFLRQGVLADDAAPIASPLSLAIGTATSTQTDGTIAIASNKFNFTTQTTPVWGDQSIRSQLVNLISGAAMVVAATLNFSTKNDMHIGWWATTSINNNMRLGLYPFSGAVGINQTAFFVNSNIAFNTATEYPTATAWRSGNYQTFWKSTYWQRLWSFEQSDTQMYAGIANSTAVFAVDDWNGKPIATTEFDEETFISGSLSASTNFSTPENGSVVQITMTTRPSSGSAEFLRFRIRDANNYWSVDVSSAGLITLYEVIDGAVNNRSSGGTAASGAIIRVFDYDSTIRVISNTALAIYYTSGFNYRGSTDARIESLGTGGAFSNLRVYKYYLRDESGLGSDLVVNGNFTTDTIWGKGTGWTIGLGLATKAAGSASNLSQTSILTSGVYYELVFTVSGYSAGTLNPNIGGSIALAPISANGTYTVRGVALGTSLIFNASSTFAGSIDVVSCRAIQYTSDNLGLELDGVING